jgi:hypothetical protein
MLLLCYVAVTMQQGKIDPAYIKQRGFPLWGCPHRRLTLMTPFGNRSVVILLPYALNSSTELCPIDHARPDAFCLMM